MKRALVWLLLLALMLSVFAGCKTQKEVTQGTLSDDVTEVPVTTDGPGANEAMEYLESLYQDEGSVTAADYSRYSTIRVGGIPFTVTWSTDIPDQIKITDNGDGTCTIDINEESEKDTPYVLTATITDEYGNTATHSWNYVMPEKIDPGPILEAAYALKPGEELPYEVTLTGKIKSIDTPYDDNYKNVTVTIEMEGHEDKPIKCYRLKGEGADKLALGNIVTVTGKIKNYNGTIEFDAGCILDRVQTGEAVEIPTDPFEIIDAAYDLARGDQLPYPVTLSGIITSVDTPYSEQYGNITVTIAIPGRLNKPITCYRMKGPDAEVLKALKTSDVITVTGTIVNYEGTREFNAGCQLLKVEPGSGHTQPKDPVKVVEEAYNLPLAGNLLYDAELTGKITKINTRYSASYGNITVTFVVEGAEDKPIECYRMTGDKSKLAALKVGDIITVKGLIKNYYSFSNNTSKIQYDKPVMLDCILNSAPSTPTNSAMKPVADVKVGTAYKFGFQQNNLSGKPWHMITGAMDGYYGDTVTDAAQAIDTYIEEAPGGGYYIYTQKGSTKQYINIVVSGTYYNLKYQTTPSSVWQLNTQYKYVTTTCTDGTEVYLGTYGQNSTLGASKTSYISDTSKIGVSQFCAYFLEIDPNGGSNTPDTPDEPTTETTIITNPVAGTAYKMIMEQKNNGTTLFFDGNTESASVNYRLAGVEDSKAAIDVYLEQTTGGYYLYFMNGNQKTYIRVYERTDGAAGKGKGSLELVTSAPAEVLTWNSTYNTLVYKADADNSYFLGTYNTFTTFSVSNLSYLKDSTVDVTQFPARFATVSGESGGGEDTGVAVITKPATGTAYKMLMDQKTNGTTLFFNGQTESASVSYRLATVEELTGAVDVYLEAANGGYYLYFMNGNQKTYIRIYERTDGNAGYGKGSLELVTSAPAEVLTWDSTYNTLVYKADADNSYFLGTYSTFVTFSVSNTSYLKASTVDVTQFPARFAIGGQGGGNTPDTPDTPTTGDSFVDAPAAETAYKFGVYLPPLNNANYYVDGTFGEKYLNTTTDEAKAVDVYYANNGNGISLYTVKDGAKYYIDIIPRETDNTKVRVVFKTADAQTPTIYNMNTQYKYLTTTVNGVEYTLGTYTNNKDGVTYETLSASKSSFLSDPSVIGVTQFPAWFIDPNGTGGNTPDTPDTPDTPTTPTTGEYVKNPVAGTAYKMGMNKGDGTVLYFNGQTESASVTYRLATTTNAAEAVDVYLEAVNGGYRLYFMNGSTKTYIRVFHRTDGDPGYGKGSLEFVTTAPSEVFTYNTEANTLFYDYDGNNAYYMGTYSSFTTFSVSNTSYITGSKASTVDVSQFPARFYASNGGTVTPPVTPEPDPEPEVPTVSGTKYTISDYEKGATGAAKEAHELDSNVTVTVYNKAVFDKQIRLYNSTDTNYADAHAVISSKKAMTKIVLNAGYRESVMKIWVSNDGTNWTALNDIAVGSVYADFTVDLGGAYTYVKIQAASLQIRIPYFIVTFKD